jgi:hypothetical protein
MLPLTQAKPLFNQKRLKKPIFDDNFLVNKGVMEFNTYLTGKITQNDTLWEGGV